MTWPCGSLTSTLPAAFRCAENPCGHRRDCLPAKKHAYPACKVTVSVRESKTSSMLGRAWPGAGVKMTSSGLPAGFEAAWPRPHAEQMTVAASAAVAVARSLLITASRLPCNWWRRYG
jgi:hypothetical protein